jgi:hypothetical protein
MKSNPSTSQNRPVRGVPHCGHASGWPAGAVASAAGAGWTGAAVIGRPHTSQ